MSVTWKRTLFHGLLALKRPGIRMAGLLMLLGMASSLLAQTSAKRPRVLGISHAAVYVHDLNRARAFYEGFLGFNEFLSIKRQDGTDRIVLIKVNDEQWLELFAEDADDEGQFSHFAIYTDDAVQMRDFLVSRGVFVPDKVHKGQTGKLFFTVRDPNGHLLEIVEQPAAAAASPRQQSLPATRIAGHLTHVGILSGSVGPALKFYRDILGFRQFWHGSSADDQLHWISIRVPDGTDYIELMLYKDLPPAKERGLQNHIGLESADLSKTIADLRSRSLHSAYARPIEVLLGKDRKQQASLWDPDGTRIEITASSTVDEQRAAAPGDRH